MTSFKEINPNDFNISPFKLIGKDWMLIVAGNKDKANAMTASWGGLGVMWNKNVSYVVIRPQRYTKEFIDNLDTFSLCFFDESYRKTLSYMGTISGRNEDKIKNSKLTLDFFNDTPIFAEAKNVIICKKLYAQNYDPNLFIDKQIDEQIYPNKDYHTLYISEVMNILGK